MKLPIRLKGGPGSGHKGHAGRPGRVGGSSARLGASKMAHMAKKSNWESVNEQGYHKGVSDSYKVHIKDDGDALVKPGTNEYSDYDPNDPYKDEDVYRLAVELGFEGSVPMAATASVRRGEKASVQEWQYGTKTMFNAYGEFDKSEVDMDSFEQIMWIDAIIGNTDRHGGNMLFGKKAYADGSVKIRGIGIDHNLCLMDSKRIRNTGRDIYDPLRVMRKGASLYNYSGARKEIENYKFNKSYYSRCMDFLNTDSKLYNRMSARYGDSFMSEARQRVMALGNRLNMIPGE